MSQNSFFGDVFRNNQEKTYTLENMQILDIHKYLYNLIKHIEQNE